jgi:hypothetical protein
MNGKITLLAVVAVLSMISAAGSSARAAERLSIDKQVRLSPEHRVIRTRLRDKYPDAAFERTLHYVRDHEAEERHERALSGLISLLAKAAVDDWIAEQSRAQVKPGPKPS